MQQHATKVFIADDHPVVALGLQQMLQQIAPDLSLAGHALNSDELFKALPEVRPDLVFLDLNMPGSDFYRNIQELRDHFPHTRIIIFTGYDGPELVKSLFDAGVHGFLLKTVTAAELGQAIQTVLSGDTYSHVRDRSAQSSDEKPGPAELLKDNFRKRLRLSRREQEILVLISKGLTSQRIGKLLFISKYTVETHRKNILRKLELNSSTELVKFAIQQGLV